MHLSTSPNVQGLMPPIVPLITQFLNEVAKLPPDERMRRINRVLEALSGR
jgi:hypothetical protein